jgi:D-sedoheptulose 7-phosphate isomerase
VNITNRIDIFSDVITDAVSSDKMGNTLALDDCINGITSELELLRTRDSHVYLIGNGGSAGIASHMMIDLLNMSKIKAHTLYDLSMLTCISNDYGYENVFKSPLDVMLNDGDILVAISSSGESNNILNAVKCAQSKNIYAITLSGFSERNSLRTMGDMNIWLNSQDYGIVEIGHAFLLHNIADRLALNKRV